MPEGGVGTSASSSTVRPVLLWTCEVAPAKPSATSRSTSHNSGPGKKGNPLRGRPSFSEAATKQKGKKGATQTTETNTGTNKDTEAQRHRDTQQIGRE